MLLSPRKNGLTSLFKEVRVFKALNFREKFRASLRTIFSAADTVLVSTAKVWISASDT